MIFFFHFFPPLSCRLSNNWVSWNCFLRLKTFLQVHKTCLLPSQTTWREWTARWPTPPMVKWTRSDRIQSLPINQPRKSCLPSFARMSLKKWDLYVFIDRLLFLCRSAWRKKKHPTVFTKALLFANGHMICCLKGGDYILIFGKTNTIM